MRKMKKEEEPNGKEQKRKAEDINNLIEDIVNEKLDLPNKALICLDFGATLDIFTKKKLEIIDCINRYNPKSVQQLANLTKRMKQAVDRDLKILERYEIVELMREGRNVIPRVKREVILFNLKGQKLKEPSEVVVAQVYVENKNVNKKILEVIS